MPVTYQGYAIPATVTPALVASNLEQAFEDAGLIASGGTWFDSVTNTVENRVLEVVYDASKTYGKTYYWFQFSGADIFCHVARGWNTTSKIPAGRTGVGTQYLDWIATVTNTTAFHCRITPAFNTNQGLTISRYTSQARPNFSAFLFTNGSATQSIIIERTAPEPSMVDLNKEIYTSMMWPRLTTSTSTGEATFQLFPFRLRGSYLGRGLRGMTTNSEYGVSNTAASPWTVFSGGDNFLRGRVYGAPGNVSNSTSNYTYGRPVEVLPVAFTNTNPDFTADVRPFFSGPIFNGFSAASLPSDFAIVAIYDNNTIQPGEVIVVTAGVEEYYVIAVANSSAANDGRPTMVFAARKV